MKDIRPAIRKILLDDSAVSAMVGTDPATARIYPMQLPQGVVDPSLVYNRVSEVVDYHMLGGSGLQRVRVQLDAWATRASLADQLSRAAFDRISGFKGVEQGVTIQGVFAVNGREDYDGTTSMFRRITDYEIWFN